MSEKAKTPGWPRLLITGGLAALVPKCLACVAVYLALGVGLAAQTSELCGSVADNSPWSQGRFIMAASAVSVCTSWLMTRRRARG